MNDLALNRYTEWVAYVDDVASPLHGLVAAGLVHGGEGGASFARGSREFFQTRPADGGGRLLQFEEPSLSLLAVEPDAQRALRRMATARARVRVLLFGGPHGAPVVWDEPTRLDEAALSEAAAGALAGLRLELAHAGAGAAVERGPDLLRGAADGARIAGGLTDAGGGLGTGWAASAASIVAVANGAQTVRAAAGQTARAWVERVLPAPAPGHAGHGAVRLAVRAWADLGAVEGDPLTPEQAWLFVEALDRDGAVLGTAYEPVFEDGPEDVALRLPAGTWSVRAGVEVEAPSGAPSGALLVRAIRLAPGSASASGGQTGLVLVETEDPDVAVLFVSPPAEAWEIGDATAGGVVEVEAPGHAWGEEEDGLITIYTDDV